MSAALTVFRVPYTSNKQLDRQINIWREGHQLSKENTQEVNSDFVKCRSSLRISTLVAGAKRL